MGASSSVCTGGALPHNPSGEHRQEVSAPKPKAYAPEYASFLPLELRPVTLSLHVRCARHPHTVPWRPCPKHAPNAFALSLPFRSASHSLHPKMASALPEGVGDRPRH